MGDAQQRSNVPPSDGVIEHSASVYGLLEERAKTHGEAWIVSSEVVRFLHNKGLIEPLLRTEHSYNWYIILNKLIRILYTPHLQDHWDDIAGYATLSANRIQKAVMQLKDEEDWSLGVVGPDGKRW